MKPVRPQIPLISVAFRRKRSYRSFLLSKAIESVYAPKLVSIVGPIAVTVELR
ncbi:hypothetical protein K443DRAFT_676606 [Laccaria amethystina LaAM-08-1]|uniref:Uncharacterized protein n=1 Tax=Laccaria amethystina LaAM-08-1 TaxID=1095629 RepID=A0A0C9XPU3_9AGAR|nr:hypothetical protein K443DRAFT_676606 [Laccaria amethystina LaAM-08-1]